MLILRRISLYPAYTGEVLLNRKVGINCDVLWGVADIPPDTPAGRVFAADADLPRVGAEHPAHNGDQCGFAGAVLSQQAEYLSGADFQVHAAQDFCAPV